MSAALGDDAWLLRSDLPCQPIMSGYWCSQHESPMEGEGRCRKVWDAEFVAVGDAIGAAYLAYLDEEAADATRGVQVNYEPTPEGRQAFHRRLASAALHAERDEVEADLRMLRASHPAGRIACQGYHQQSRWNTTRPSVTARHLCLFTDGRIQRLCARCAYGFDGMDIVQRLPIRYPTSVGA